MINRAGRQVTIELGFSTSAIKLKNSSYTCNVMIDVYCLDHISSSGHCFFSTVCHLQLRGKPMVRQSQDGKVFKRITGRLCQTTQDKKITFTNPTLWCPPHKMSLSSAIIEHWADYYCAEVISYALCLLTFKVSVCPVSDFEHVLSAP